MLERLLLQSSHYTIGTLLVTLASMISFPVFTRTFSVTEYGALNLLGAVLLFWTGVGKLGVQQSITRFHAEVGAGKRDINESQFAFTVVAGMTATGAAATLGWALMSILVPAEWWRNEQVAALMLPLSALVVVRVLDSAVTNILRAQQRSILLNSYMVVRKYLSLGVILALMFTVAPGLKGFFLGSFLVECGALAVMFVVLFRHRHLSLADYSSSTFRAMLAFGIPLIALELSGIILILGDRYVIQWLLGGDPLGHYSAAYNLCEYVRAILFGSFAQAVAPIYMRTWEQSGREATLRFIERSLRLYFLIAAAVCAGMAAVGGSVLTLLASEKYEEGIVVIPYVIIGMCFDSATGLLGAGVFIHKQNNRIIPYFVVAAVGNIILNFVLIPQMGLAGAGLSTMVCYAFTAISVWWIGRNQLSFRIPVLDICKFAALATIMYWVVRLLPVTDHFEGLTLKILTGICVYGALVLAFDRETREMLSAARVRYISGDGYQADKTLVAASLAKRAIKSSISTSLGWRMSAPFRGGGVVVLLYHRINAGKKHFPGMPLAEFRNQMAWIKRNCTPIAPEDIPDAMRFASRIRPPVVVTFDDGYRDYHDAAYPVLQDFHIPSTMFLTTGFMDKGGLIWTEALHWATSTTVKSSLLLPWNPDRSRALATSAEKALFIAEAKQYLKSVSNEEREAIIVQLLGALETMGVEEHLGRQMLSWDEVRATLEGTTIGGHSHTHPILSQLSPWALESEIRTCRDRILAETGKTPRCFAYPNGRAVDFNDQTREVVRRFGFEMAFSTVEGIIGPGSDFFALNRVFAGSSVEDLATNVSKALSR